MARVCFSPLRAPAHLHTTLTNGRRNLQLLEAGCSRCYSLSRCGAAYPSGGGSAVSATPAFLIRHGSADCNIPPQQGKVLADAIDAAAGAGKATYTLIPGAGHGTSEFSASDNVKIVLDFLARALQ